MAKKASKQATAANVGFEEKLWAAADPMAAIERSERHGMGVGLAIPSASSRS